jgi:hypothetical protein
MGERILDIETCSECGAEIHGEVCATCSTSKVTKLSPEETKSRDRKNKQRLFLAASICLLLTLVGFELAKDGSYLAKVLCYVSAVAGGIMIVVGRFRYP